MYDQNPFKFQPFPKVPRLSRDMIISEKIDGTNASVWVWDKSIAKAEGIELPWEAYHLGQTPFAVSAGSRKRFITPEKDNFGFARWVYDRAEELVTELGHGVHYGEWWGSGIQRGYGLEKGEKRFSLFNTKRWAEEDLTLCNVVPVLYEGPFTIEDIDYVMEELRFSSVAAPGYDSPEGVMIYHTAANQIFKKTFEGDEGGKGQ